MNKMKLSSNMIRFYDVFGMKGMIDLFSEVGFEAIDFNLDIKEFHDGTYGNDYYTEIKKYANDKGIIFGQTHAPYASAYSTMRQRHSLAKLLTSFSMRAQNICLL